MEATGCPTKEYLKTRVSFIFKKAKSEGWEVTTWSKNVARSNIEKYGTEQDKANLLPSSFRNKTRKQSTKETNQYLTVKRCAGKFLWKNDKKKCI